MSGIYLAEDGTINDPLLDPLWRTEYIDSTVSKVEISEDGTVWIYAPDMAYPIVLPMYFLPEELK